MEFVAGLMKVLSPEYLLYATIGCFLGTLVGVLPGVGAATAVALLFPFTAYLPPDGMIIALAAIYYGAQYGGSTSAILMNVPGEVASMVTALDGHALMKQGRAGPALAMAAIASFIAGIAGAILVSLAGPTIARLALSFGPAEYLGLGLFSLVAVSSMSGQSLLKGIIVALVGMILVVVGFDDASGLERMTFGQVFLLQGFHVVPMMIGLFGLGEILSTSQAPNVIASKIGRIMPTREDFRLGLPASIRATGISMVIGLLPGMMPSIGSFLCYSAERQRSKTPQKFGQGAIEGVAAAEAANNGTAMSNLIPLLGLGVPTGPTMALLVAAFGMYGIVPGPTLFTQQADLVWALIASFFVANIILLILNLPLVGLWVRLARIPYGVLAPIIIVICLVGAYSTRNTMVDVWVCVGAGFLGWQMKIRNWPIAPLVLAYVLGPMIELSARQVISISPLILFERWIFWVFMIMLLAVVIMTRRSTLAADTAD